MADAQIRTSVAMEGSTYEGVKTITGNYSIPLNKRLAAAKSGVLTVRTDDNTGSLTMNAGHGIITGDRLDVYWDVGGVKGSRRGMIVGTVAGNVVPIDGGAGDNLPVAASAITAMVPTVFNVTITGNNVQVLVLFSQRTGSIVFTQTDNTLIYGKTIHNAPDQEVWYTGNGVTNPLLGATVGKVYMSHGFTAGEGTVRAGVLTN